MNETVFTRALHALRNGEAIIYPTDTLYALGADLYNEDAVRKVFNLKQRPFSVPLPIAVASVKEIETVAELPEYAHRIIDRFLPGTLTVILQKKPSVPTIVTSGEATVAVRIPNHPLALRLLKVYGPLTVTSANRHHEKTPGVIKDILMQLQTKTLVSLDVGRLVATPSTIVDLSTSVLRVVRQGIITEQELLDVMTHG
ncbi:MAG TPA: L-threonylcarbamoyladenylate synthase [Candidatus Thermoplasmatota archaeon]|nr:L-threonylcarbamoyladenylate synthase [Candidatus Thermoplasmatota archaeon]